MIIRRWQEWSERKSPWAKSIRVRFLVIHVLLLAVPLAGVFFARFYEREMLKALEEDMIHQAMSVAAVVVAEPDVPLSSREPFLRAIAHGTRSRIRLFDAAGHLVADSHREGPPEGKEADPPGFLPHVVSARSSPHVVQPVAEVESRPEIKRALLGLYGSTTRLYERGNRLFLFIAVPIVSAQKVLGVVYLTRSTNPVRAAMYRIRSNLVLVFGIALATTIIISLFLARTVSAPLRNLSQAAEQVAAGNRRHPLTVPREDEIGRLATSIALMRDKLDARAQEVAELSANISHEFKSPLTSLRGAAELLLEGAAEDEKTREKFLKNILADARRLDRLVTRLLELSRVEADASPTEELDWDLVVRETCEAREWNWALYIPPGIRLRGRRPPLVAALGNLLDNAMQHSLPGTTISVVVKTNGEVVRTTVHNLAKAPISRANLTRVWDRFFTTRGSRGGSGLGLPIVLAAAKSHGGTVGAESSEERGTMFWFEIPVNGLPGAADRSPSDRSPP